MVTVSTRATKGNKNENKNTKLGGKIKILNTPTNISNYRGEANLFVIGDRRSGESSPGQTPSEGRGEDGNGGGRDNWKGDEMTADPDREIS